MKTPQGKDQRSEKEELILAVRSALSLLRLTALQDEEILDAKAALNEWLLVNDPHWR